MGFVRAAFAVLIAAVAWMSIAKADDYGPRRGIREVRAAVPILVHRTMQRVFLTANVAVDDAIVGDDNAIVDFHGELGRGVAVLTYRNATWWLIGAAFEQRIAGRSYWTIDSPTIPAGCETTLRTAPTPAYLQEALGAKAATVALWSSHGTVPQSVSPPAWPRRSGEIPQACESGAIYLGDDVATAVANDDGYRISWISSAVLGLTHAHGRAPTDAEMSGPGANSIFYIYAVGGPAALTAPKSTLSIWCPFVLDPSVHYIIEFSGADGRLGPIRGTLDDNTLTFEIPAFTAPANADLRGEVDYLPYREH